MSAGDAPVRGTVDAERAHGAWGVAAFTTADGLQTFLIGVAVPAGLALFTALKTLAAKRLGDPSTAAIN